jgi:hypothetical protein
MQPLLMPNTPSYELTFTDGMHWAGTIDSAKEAGNAGCDGGIAKTMDTRTLPGLVAGFRPASQSEL